VKEENGFQNEVVCGWPCRKKINPLTNHKKSINQSQKILARTTPLCKPMETNTTPEDMIISRLL
jgi:hypothetical protein